ncbi:hypothetical protein [Asticcacaulis sp. AC402]|uniref:hypothetical protein n=1 Tax=Asticcacaulis sp. AC402 TaxID=1282361 RepID=UPI000418573A|nr:hypothetical protein [Asticcacaulis sp. AC402]
MKPASITLEPQRSVPGQSPDCPGKRGVVECLDITGAADIYVDGTQAGFRDYACSGHC